MLSVSGRVLGFGFSGMQCFLFDRRVKGIGRFHTAESPYLGMFGLGVPQLSSACSGLFISTCQACLWDALGL